MSKQETFHSIRLGACAAEYAEFFAASDLAGNQSWYNAGSSLADLIGVSDDGEYLTFTGEVLDYLRDYRSRYEDGCVTDDESGTRVWIQGEGYLVEAAA